MPKALVDAAGGALCDVALWVSGDDEVLGAQSAPGASARARCPEKSAAERMGAVACAAAVIENLAEFPVARGCEQTGPESFSLAPNRPHSSKLG